MLSTWASDRRGCDIVAHRYWDPACTAPVTPSCIKQELFQAEPHPETLHVTRSFWLHFQWGKSRLPGWTLSHHHLPITSHAVAYLPGQNGCCLLHLVGWIETVGAQGIFKSHQGNQIQEFSRHQHKKWVWLPHLDHTEWWVSSAEVAVVPFQLSKDSESKTCLPGCSYEFKANLNNLVRSCHK